jgi:predicted phage baseplate assembly protein
LAYTYKRDTVSIYANVVRATHGETRSETLGSGDGSKALQRFTLKQSPLTYVAAATPAGAQSTLKVRINDILWHEADSLAGLGPTDRSYTTETDDADKTAVIFGNGQYGARLSTGIENVKAVYRSGIGKPGNVKAEQITLLATKPLGVKSVINPLRASGGADRDSRDQARRNVPLALMALDRLVSVQDYADFARTYAGIGKASSVQLRTSGRQLVNVTIAGADNIPIDTRHSAGYFHY